MKTDPSAIAFFGGAIGLFGLLAIAGCKPESFQNEPDPMAPAIIYNPHGLNIQVHAFTYAGHRYLVNNTGGMLHAESCPCKTKPQ